MLGNIGQRKPEHCLASAGIFSVMPFETGCRFETPQESRRVIDRDRDGRRRQRPPCRNVIFGMEFIPILVEQFENDPDARAVWAQIEAEIGDVDGIAFYAHPSLGVRGSLPNFVVLARGFEPFVVKCVHNQLEDIKAIDDQVWTLHEETIPSPNLILEDFVFALKHRFENDRVLRRKVAPTGFLAMPHITRKTFDDKFGDENVDVDRILWAAGASKSKKKPPFPPSKNPLSDREWLLAKSVFQSAHVISRTPSTTAENETATTLGEAIKILDKRIALLDVQQLRGALQIAPGPQRIRGLAGTGKTVLLAMKAATLHQHYPDRRILFTFHTQSLYNQTRSLVTRFYRNDMGSDPDWNMVHIRHSWGSRNRDGVYYDLCQRQGAPSMTFTEAKNRAGGDKDKAFGFACRDALQRSIAPFYDYILVDEGQDLPAEFFQKRTTVAPRKTSSPECRNYLLSPGVVFPLRLADEPHFDVVSLTFRILGIKISLQVDE